MEFMCRHCSMYTVLVVRDCTLYSIHCATHYHKHCTLGNIFQSLHHLRLSLQRPYRPVVGLVGSVRQWWAHPATFQCASFSLFTSVDDIWDADGKNLLSNIPPLFVLRIFPLLPSIPTVIQPLLFLSTIPTFHSSQSSIRRSLTFLLTFHSY